MHSTFVSTVLLIGMGVLPAAADLEPRTPQVLNVPSGQPIAFHDTIIDRPSSGLTARFRFLAPELRSYLDYLGYAHMEADLAHLCESYAIKRIADPRPSLIVISLAETPTEFGSFDPDVMQVFEAYRPQGNICAWEAF